MSCPPIDDLLAGKSADHADTCDDCRAVLDLVDSRSPAACGRAEALLAARAAGPLTPDSARRLARHLAGCASCALVAGSLDAPEIADTLASAAELDRNLDHPSTAPDGDDRLVGHRAAPGDPVPAADQAPGGAHGPAADAGRGHRRAVTAGRRDHRGMVLAAIVLLAIAAAAALVTRALV